MEKLIKALGYSEVEDPLQLSHRIAIGDLSIFNVTSTLHTARKCRVMDLVCFNAIQKTPIFGLPPRRGYSHEKLLRTHSADLFLNNGLKQLLAEVTR